MCSSENRPVLQILIEQSHDPEASHPLLLPEEEKEEAASAVTGPLCPRRVCSAAEASALPSPVANDPASTGCSAVSWAGAAGSQMQMVRSQLPLASRPQPGSATSALTAPPHWPTSREDHRPPDRSHTSLRWRGSRAQTILAA